jgi:hypothetical protein
LFVVPVTALGEARSRRRLDPPRLASTVDVLPDPLRLLPIA